MDQCLTDLMDRGEQVNLPALIIKHIACIANTTRAHDLCYGFLLTRVFEHFGAELQRKVEAQVIDKVGSSTIMGWGFDLIQECDPSSKQGFDELELPLITLDQIKSRIINIPYKDRPKIGYIHLGAVWIHIQANF